MQLPCTAALAAIDLKEFERGDGRREYVRLYGEIMEIYRPSVRKVLEFLRDVHHEEGGRGAFQLHG